MRIRYENRRTVATLDGLVRLRLKIRRCHAAGCARHHRPYRPEAEGALALPQHEFGLDVIALVGALRYAEHRSVPEIHASLRGRGVPICRAHASPTCWTATTSCSPRPHRRRPRCARLLARQGRVDPGHRRPAAGRRPRGAVGHPRLPLRRGAAGQEPAVGPAADLAALLREVVDGVGVPVAGVVSDGQHSIRKAVGEALPGVPHQLCHFHYLREAARPIYEADRHAKKELKKQVRGVRPIERPVEGRDRPEAEVVRGYCAAVRSALTDDGRPPLEASGLKLHGAAGGDRRQPGRVEAKGGRRASRCGGSRP